MTNNETKLEHKDIWKFTYKDIYCEIAHWGVGYMNDGDGIWNSYISLYKNKVTNFDKLLCKKVKFKLANEHIRWDYGDINKMFDFHGDITYYEAIRDEFNGKIVGVKIGCDYAHLWDKDRTWNETIIAQDLKNTIDKYLQSL